MRYEEILRRSLRIVWTRKYLWVLALLAGEGFGGGSSGNLTSGQPNFQSGAGSASAGQPDFSPVSSWVADHLGLILLIAAAVAVIWLIWFLVGCVASGAMIRASAELDSGADFRFGQAWRAGLSTFWRVLALRLGVFLVIAVPTLLGFLVAGLLVLNNRPFGALLIAAPFIVLVAVLAIVLGALYTLAIRACVLDGLGPWASYRRAVELVLTRTSRVVITLLLMIAVGIGAGILTGLVFTLITLPFVGPLFDAFGRQDYGRAFGSLALLFAVTTPISILIGAPIGAYFSTVWTVAYRRFGAEPEAPPAPALAA